MERFLNEREAANVIGYSRAWLQKKRVTGGGPPFVRVGPTIRYPLSNLFVWMNNFGMVRNTTERPTGPRQPPSPVPHVGTLVVRRMVKGRERAVLVRGVVRPTGPS